MSANMHELFHFDIDGVDKLKTFSELSDDKLANTTSIHIIRLSGCIDELIKDANLLQLFSNALSRSQIEKIDLSGNAFNPFFPLTQLASSQFKILKQLLSACPVLIYIEGFNDFTLAYQTELMAILNANHERHTTLEQAMPAMPVA